MIKVLCLAAAALLAATPTFAQDITTDVQAAYATWDAAFNKGDAAALSEAYAPDALFLAPDHEVRKGPDGVQKFFGGLFDAGVTNHKLTLIDAGGMEGLIYSTASWKAQAKGDDGKMKEIGGIATHVFEAQADGPMKLKVHTFN